MRRTYRHLSLEDRARIEAYLEAGQKPAAVARLLGRSRSTITREIARNGSRGLHRNTRGRVHGKYRSEPAERQARRIERRPRVRRKLRLDTPLWPIVLGHLEQGLSPEQIAGTLRRMPTPVRISHETLYTTLYAMPRGKLRDHVLTLPRRRHKAPDTPCLNDSPVAAPLPASCVICHCLTLGAHSRPLSRSAVSARFSSPYSAFRFVLLESGRSFR